MDRNMWQHQTWSWNGHSLCYHPGPYCSHSDKPWFPLWTSKWTSNVATDLKPTHHHLHYNSHSQSPTLLKVLTHLHPEISHSNLKRNYIVYEHTLIIRNQFTYTFYIIIYVYISNLKDLSLLPLVGFHIMLFWIYFYFTFCIILGSSRVQNDPIRCTAASFDPHGKGDALGTHVRVMAALSVMVSVVYMACLTICVQTFTDLGIHQGGACSHGTGKRTLYTISYRSIHWQRHIWN